MGLTAVDLAAKAIFLLVAGLVCWALRRAARARPIFVVVVDGGEPRTASGTVTRAFLGEVRAIAALHGVTRGRVVGVEHGLQIRLKFLGLELRQEVRLGGVID
ncbi:MAG: DUF3634 family protein, partial [Isosphaeraceae bacterium]|nr:DUF3634 family protein [Isosphaeraceae bacterium]